MIVTRCSGPRGRHQHGRRVGRPDPGAANALRAALAILTDDARLKAAPCKLAQDLELLVADQSLKPSDVRREGPESLRQLVQDDRALVHSAPDSSAAF